MGRNDSGLCFLQRNGTVFATVFQCIWVIRFESSGGGVTLATAPEPDPEFYTYKAGGEHH